MSDSLDYIEATIVGNNRVRIERINSQCDWDESVHAINWFDARQLQLYNLYNFLASRSVVKVGGSPVFKGRLLSRHLGSDEDERQVLLLVNYPSPKQFKNMLTDNYFKLVGVLRTLAVKRFTFCLSHSIGRENIPKKSAEMETYGVHHFRGDKNTLELIRAALTESSANIAFSSLKSHQLSTVSRDKDPVMVPVIMDGIVLFRCENETMLNDIVSTDQYQKSLQHSQSSYIGLYQRIL